ncbi:MAG: class I tRNA ligase family protein [Candidatus Nomurabacteria bacterium]|jgi:isoleucyl-tRNA synthetase|nr:class I tRNA ligase family protein [Candidatus Nomurabacteria bacterium]
MKFKHGTRRKAAEYEKDIAEQWKKNGTFEKSVEQRAEDNAYVFYDGPPFITGNPHHGTLLSTIIKDIVPRYQTMRGKRVERVWGWDCHGLPAENFTEKHLNGTVSRKAGGKPDELILKSGSETKNISLEEYITTARDLMVANSALWESYVERVGRWVDFKGAYRTMDKDFMESVWWAFKELYDKGKIYEGEKVLMYDTKFATPVSKNEVTMDNDAYQTVTDPSVYVKFELTRDSVGSSTRELNLPVYLLAWTTTPWTLPANMALAINPKLDYVEVKVGNEIFILAKDLVDKVLIDDKKQPLEYELLHEFTGEKLLNRDRFYKPLFDRSASVDSKKPHIKLGKNSKVLFVCYANTGRSQMAKAIYNHLTKSDNADSAGTGASKKHPEWKTIGDIERAKGEPHHARRQILENYDIDIVDWQRQQMTPEMLEKYDLVVNLMEKWETPDWLSGDNVIRWDIKDVGFYGERKDAATKHELSAIAREIIEKRIRDLIVGKIIDDDMQGEPLVCSEDAKPNFVILNGFTGFEEGKSRAFIPWLASILENDGYKVQAPILPNSDNPDVQEQVKYVLENVKFDKNTVLVGHSLGAIVAMEVVEKLSVGLRRLVLVAPAIPKFMRNEKNMTAIAGKPVKYVDTFSGGYDWRALRDETEIVLLADVQEQEHRGEYIDYLADKLNVVVRETKSNDVHFLGAEQPFVLENVLNDLGQDNAHKVYPADFVENEGGTGIVHVAPAYGEIDFEFAQEKNIPTLHAIDDNGYYLPEFAAKLGQIGVKPTDETGIEVWAANKFIAKCLEEQGKVWKIEYIQHEYPFNPRSKQRIMYRAIPSWFFDIQGQKPLMLAKNENINWFPPHLKHGRFAKNIDQAPDWTLSRNRFWATAMPVWKGDKGTVKVVGSYAELAELSGQKLDDYHRPWVDKVEFDIDGEHFTRIEEVLDGWFESGSMPFAQFHYPFENKAKFEANYPADFIVEYIGQVRAWFYYVHAVNTALFGDQAFQNVIVTGTIAGEDGRKMSKSLGNYTDPMELMDKFSADSLRFLLASSPLLSGEDFSLKDKDVSDVARKLAMIWNMYDFFTMYAEVDGWEYVSDFTGRNAAVGNKNITISFVRHGTTDWNVEGRKQGRTDIPLNEKGREQDEQAREQLKGEKFDVIFVSPLKRAYETAKIINKDLEAEIIVHNDIIERDFGSFEGNIPVDKEWDKFWNYHDNLSFDGEDIKTLFKRVHSFVDFVKENYAGKNILIVSHGGVARAFRFYFEKMPKDGKLVDYLPKNTEILKYELTVNRPFTLGLDDLTNPLDKWIVSRVHELRNHITKYLDEYNLPDAMSAILPFVDDASNWYVRRSRRRFWKSEDDGDKNDAYKTLHYVLRHLSYVMAPFTPFLAEELYHNLVGGESVHLHDWPREGEIDEKVLSDMARTREIIEKGLALRMDREDEFGQIKVRQPLAKLTYSGEKLDDFYEQIIADEVNVKSVLYNKSTHKQDSLVCIDKAITPELKREGQSREVIRVIQNTRKDAGLNVDDRIIVKITTQNEQLQKAIDEHRETIAAEILATKFAENNGYQTTAKIDNIEITIQLKKAD